MYLNVINEILQSWSLQRKNWWNVAADAVALVCYPCNIIGNEEDFHYRPLFRDTEPGAQDVPAYSWWYVPSRFIS